MTAARALTLSVALMLTLLARGYASDHAQGCSHCGCRKVRKVTRLVATRKQIKVPTYKCSQMDTFYPDKSAVCHCECRCDTFYKPHLDWHGQECRVKEESFEHVEHCVDKGHCTCKCSEEHHHKEHVEYNVRWTRCGSVSCETRAHCGKLYGASTHGCYECTSVKEPTGETCARPGLEVRWVSFSVCEKCDHCWCDSP